MTDPYEAGRAAFAAGLEQTDCPHFGETTPRNFEEWQRGWKAAQWAKKQQALADFAIESQERAARIIKAEEKGE